MENRPTRGTGSYLGLVVMAILIFMFFSPLLRNSFSSGDDVYTMEKFAQDLKENKVTRVEVTPNRDNDTGYAAITLSDGDKEILRDINLEIAPGQTIGIMGGTGSSKTSLVNLISRLYDVKDGEVLVGGHNVKEYDLEVLRNQVAVVLQKNELFSGSILDNLRWGKQDATEEECRTACRIACADEFIENMPDGYLTHIEQGGTNVSGGQKQRLCIARALLKQPKILILDDSTSAVDTATDAKIRSSEDDQADHRPAYLERAGCGQDPGARRGRDQGLRHPRGASRDQRDLP